jgi:hypothetical protein
MHDLTINATDFFILSPETMDVNTVGACTERRQAFGSAKHVPVLASNLVTNSIRVKRR